MKPIVVVGTIALLALGALLLCGCDMTPQQREEVRKNTKATIDWVKRAKKPITVTQLRHDEFTSTNEYTLIDAEANIYNTNTVGLSLPSLIEETKEGTE